MNLFWLYWAARRGDGENARLNARCYYDKHMKIILELTQVLYTVHHLHGGRSLRKHPARRLEAELAQLRENFPGVTIEVARPSDTAKRVRELRAAASIVGTSFHELQRGLTDAGGVTALFIVKRPVQERVYRATHAHHPLTLWTARTAANYRRACDVALALCDEKRERYGSAHACESHLRWLVRHLPRPLRKRPEREHSVLGKRKAPLSLQSTANPTKLMRIDDSACTPVPLCMPERFYDEALLARVRALPSSRDQPDAVLAYRAYCALDKAHLAQWKRADAPEDRAWFDEISAALQT